MLFANESGIKVDFQVVDLFTGEHYKPPFEAVNPNHLVPVLEDGDFRLTESSAILKYLAEKTGSPAYPKDLQQRARVNERMDWINTQLCRDLAAFPGVRALVQARAGPRTNLVAALNRAPANIPPDRVRLHVCWGNYEGPHTFDVPLEDLLPHLFLARVGGFRQAALRAGRNQRPARGQHDANRCDLRRRHAAALSTGGLQALRRLAGSCR